jgi:hypothetical protein
MYAAMYMKLMCLVEPERKEGEDKVRRTRERYRWKRLYSGNPRLSYSWRAGDMAAVFSECQPPRKRLGLALSGPENEESLTIDLELPLMDGRRGGREWQPTHF